MGSSVPGGEYSKEVITSLKLYDKLQDQLVFAKDVRQVLSHVETGNVDTGIVYKTDAKLSNKIKSSPQHQKPLTRQLSIQ